MSPDRSRVSGVRSVLLAVAVAGYLTTSTSAQIPDAAWKTFIEGSYSPNRPVGVAPGFEDYLYESARRYPAQREAVAAFAARIGVSPETGGEYAALIVESVRRQNEGCRGGPCTFASGDAFYDHVASVAEPTGQLLIAVGKDLDRESRLSDRGWVGLAVRHPAARNVLQALLDYTREPELLVAMLAATDPAGWNPVTLAVPASCPGHRYIPDDWNGWFDTFLQLAERRARESSAPLSVRAAIAQRALSHELDLGLVRTAVQQYLAYPPEIRSRVPVASAVHGNPTAGADGYVFADDLAAALWQTGHVADARTQLRERIEGLGARTPRGRARFAALSDLFAPSGSVADLFDRYLLSDGLEDHSSCSWPPDVDWWDLVMESPAIRPLAAARLRQAGYVDLSQAIESDELYPRWETPAGVLGGYARFFAASAVEAHARWSALIDGVWHASRDAAAAGPLQVRGAAKGADWPERPLPSGLSAWRDTDPPSRPPTNLALPVDPDAVLRYAAVGPEHAIVYQSSDYDLSGEVGAAGVWFAQTEGGRWTRPVYLGFQQHLPYVVTPGSRLPLLRGDMLQLEVRIREIDPTSIIFPPVVTGLRREADGRYLTIDLVRARADGDGDGLTDIEEGTLGLDPAKADTDADGLPDGTDPLPLTAYRPGASALDASLARAVINRIQGHDAEALVEPPAADQTASRATTHTRTGAFFLIGDPGIFAGLASAPRRVLVYSEADLRALNRGPVFYPPKILHFFSSLDHRRYFVEWSAQWVGGRFLVTCTPTGSTCETKDLRGWVS